MPNSGKKTSSKHGDSRQSSDSMSKNDSREGSSKSKFGTGQSSDQSNDQERRGSRSDER